MLTRPFKRHADEGPTNLPATRPALNDVGGFRRNLHPLGVRDDVAIGGRRSRVVDP